VEFAIQYIPHVETIQVVLDSKLLRAADAAARKAHVNRSALIREALREHLRRVEIQALEEREREAYRRHPDTASDVEAWGQEAVWPAK
jgi:Arc/MetJ-type ribon-helix-helix transcriptional regulator